MNGETLIEKTNAELVKNFSVFVSYIDGYNIFPNYKALPITGINKIEGNIVYMKTESRSVPMLVHELHEEITSKCLEGLEFAIEKEDTIIKMSGLDDIGYSDRVVHIEGEIL